MALQQTVPFFIPGPYSDAVFDRDDSDADLLLISEGGQTFYVHSSILRTASPVLANMFTFPSPPNIQPEDRQKVQMTESTSTLANLLRFVYPMADPDLTDANEIADVVTAAHKYEMDFIENKLEVLLRPRVDEEPLRVYGLASAANLKVLQARALERCMQDPKRFLLEARRDDLKHLSAEQLHDLRTFHDTVQCVARKTVLESRRWIARECIPWTGCAKCKTRLFVWVAAKGPDSRSYRHTYDSGCGIALLQEQPRTLQPRQWWTAIAKAIVEAMDEHSVLGFQTEQFTACLLKLNFPASLDRFSICSDCKDSFMSVMSRLHCAVLKKIKSDLHEDIWRTGLPLDVFSNILKELPVSIY
ncbi:hypothetical protein PsYK624_088340 [Phanerochaete sordida]|uniref:BTB domain-containing protein n=1 Tax=Phanerochaete sordida TaxID=48140 RepID=A0A9P3LFI7_9APHY|nr:hypothetical protein PsYK624_088340 [Phanerochaete sordida]